MGIKERTILGPAVTRLGVRDVGDLDPTIECVQYRTLGQWIELKK